MEIINSKIVLNFQEVFLRFVRDIQMAPEPNYLNFFRRHNLEGNLRDTLIVQSYMQSIVFSNELISAATIYYAENNLLINNNFIIYDLFYDHWDAHLAKYPHLMDTIANIGVGNTREYFYQENESTITAVRALYAGQGIDVLFLVEYDLEALSLLIGGMVPSGKDLLIADSSGNVFSCSSSKDTDMRFRTSLNRSWKALAFSENGSKFYIALSNRQIYTYNSSTFQEETAKYESLGYPQFLFVKGNTLIAVSREASDKGTFFVETVKI